MHIVAHKHLPATSQKTKECYFSFSKKRDSVSCILHVVEEDIEFLTLLLLPPECWDYSSVMED